MSAIASQITSLMIIYSTVLSDADQRKHQKRRVTGLCVGISPMTGEFPAQMTSNAENVSILMTSSCRVYDKRHDYLCSDVVWQPDISANF